MRNRPKLRYHFNNILIISGLCVLVNLGFNFTFYGISVVEFTKAILIGGISGLIIGSLEEFILRKKLRSFPFVGVVVVRIILYSLFLGIIILLFRGPDMGRQGDCLVSDCLLPFLMSEQFLRDGLFLVGSTFVAVFFLQVSIMIGQKNFLRYIFGAYHHPNLLNLVIMFVDLNGSTRIGERLGTVKYSQFIKDYFEDLTEAVLIYKASVHQYVGDEILLYWSVKAGIRRNACVDCFFYMKKILKERSGYYIKNYGFEPSFKGAIHIGIITETEVGTLKRDIVFHGDLLNTTSRMIGQCHNYQQELILSKRLVVQMELENKYRIKTLGEIILPGKKDEIHLIGVEEKASGKDKPD